MESWTGVYMEEQNSSALAAKMEVCDVKFVGPYPRVLWTLTPL